VSVSASGAQKVDSSSSPTGEVVPSVVVSVSGLEDVGDDAGSEGVAASVGSTRRPLLGSLGEDSSQDDGAWSAVDDVLVVPSDSGLDGERAPVVSDVGPSVVSLALDDGR